MNVQAGSFELDQHPVGAGLDPLAADHQGNLGLEGRRRVRAGSPEPLVARDGLAVVGARTEDVRPAAKARTAVLDLQPLPALGGHVAVLVLGPLGADHRVRGTRGRKRGPVLGRHESGSGDHQSESKNRGSTQHASCPPRATPSRRHAAKHTERGATPRSMEVARRSRKHMRIAPSHRIPARHAKNPRALPVAADASRFVSDRARRDPRPKRVRPHGRARHRGSGQGLRLRRRRRAGRSHRSGRPGGHGDPGRRDRDRRLRQGRPRRIRRCLRHRRPACRPRRRSGRPTTRPPARRLRRPRPRPRRRARRPIPSKAVRAETRAIERLEVARRRRRGAVAGRDSPSSPPCRRPESCAARERS